MKNIFEVSMDFLRKIEQFFMNKFLHSKFPKMRWICDMSRAELILTGSIQFECSEIDCLDSVKMWRADGVHL